MPFCWIAFSDGADAVTAVAGSMSKRKFSGEAVPVAAMRGDGGCAAAGGGNWEKSKSGGVATAVEVVRAGSSGRRSGTEAGNKKSSAAVVQGEGREAGGILLPAPLVEVLSPEKPCAPSSSTSRALSNCVAAATAAALFSAGADTLGETGGRWSSGTVGTGGCGES